MLNFKKLQTKILSGYITVILIFAVIAGVSYLQLKAMEAKVDQLTNTEFALYQINEKLAFNFAERASLVRGYMLYGKQQYIDDFHRVTSQSAELETALLAMSDSDEEADMIARSAAWSKAVVEELLPAVDRGNEAETMSIAGRISPETAALIKVNSDLAEARESNIADLTKQVSAEQKRIVLILFASTGVAAVLSIFLGLFLARSITTPVGKLVSVAEQIAEGDLDVQFDINSKDEIGTLAVAFAKMADNLNDVMSNISSAADQVASGAKQVSDSSMALSQGATEQASSIEELTASLEEISSQTNQNAGNANQANQLAEAAKVNAVEGNAQMGAMLQAMDAINVSSANISKIIKVIDEIAFQTNILALNAAVEAARAGQHGKGFTVVAEEVRNLAARSANAAKETTDLIEGSIKKVEGGTKIATQTADALNKIVDGVTKVATLVGAIALASNEQASGIAQINQGIMQVSEVVQTNSATSEEGAAASEELSSQAEMLKDQVARFKLRAGTRSFAYRGTEEMSPNVLRAIQQVGQRRSTAHSEAAATSTKRIALTDKEFGKY